MKFNEKYPMLINLVEWIGGEIQIFLVIYNKQQSIKAKLSLTL